MLRLAPILSFSLLVLGNAFFLSFVSLYFNSVGMPSYAIGLVQSIYSLGLLVGTLRANHWINKVGHVRVFPACAALIAALILSLHYLSPWFWLFPRFLTGICVGVYFVVIESWVLMEFNKTKGLALGIYTLDLYIFVSLGQVILSYTGTDPIAAIATAAFCASFAAGPMSLSARTGPVASISMPANNRLFAYALLVRSPLAAFGTFISGVVLGVLYGYMPIYISDRGFSPGPLMSVMILGGAFSQLPIGRISDRIDRRKVLLGILVVGSLAAVCCDWVESVFAFGVAVFIAGAAFFAVYPVTAALASDPITPEEQPQMTGVLLFCYGLGAIFGPLLCALLNSWTPRYMVLAIDLPAAILAGSIVLKLLARRPAVVSI